MTQCSCPVQAVRSIPPVRPMPRQVALAAVPLIVLEAALVLAWSSGFVGARFSIDYAPAFLVVFWRCVLVMLMLFPWAIGELVRTPMPTLLRHAGIGLLAMAGYLAGVVKGIEHGVPAGLAALIADLLPIGTTLLAVLVFKQRVRRGVWVGLGIGLLGVVMVMHDALAWGDAPPWSYLLPLLGMLSLAVATLLQKRSRTTMSVVPNLWLQFAVSTIVFGVLAQVEGGLVPARGTGFGLSVLWTAVLSSLGGYALYWICLTRSSPTRVASVLYLSPAVTLVWSWAMFGDALSWLMGAGTLVVGLGIWVVVRGEGR